MNSSNRLLSEIVAFRTYAKFLSHLGRRESLEETINRNMYQHLDRFPKLSKDIVKAYQRVHSLEVMPSMRALQFSGDAILKNNVRQYNCSFTPVNDVRVFGEILFLLLSGVGVGFSVQKRHIQDLPKIKPPKESGFFVIQDSIMGWAQALDLLVDAYFLGRVKPNFDFGDIRAKGSYLVTTGALAPGPEPLKKMLELVEAKLKNAMGRKLTDLECHDIICIVSDAVLAGGIRRAALISLFDRDSQDMLKCKSGEWWNNAPWRARANNSVVLPRSKVSQEEFYALFETCQASGSGEPGFFWTNDEDWGTNPCCFTGDTLVATADGRNAVTIKELCDEGYKGPVYSMLSQIGQVVTSYCSNVWVSRKNAELVKVTLDDGSSFRCTPDHRIMLRTGQYVQASELIAGTSLMPFNSFKRKDRNYRMISSNTGRDLAQYAHVAQAFGLIKEGYEKQHIHHKDGNGLNDLLSNLETISASEHNREHMLGSSNSFFKIRNVEQWKKKQSKRQKGIINTNSNGISSEEFVLRITEKTIELGRELKVKEALEICNLKFMNKSRLADLQTESLSNFCREVYSRYNHKVKSVEYLQECEDVYDMTVEGTHNFAIITSSKDSNFIESSGVFVHNCEIALNPNQFCNLTTINQTGIRSEKDFLNRVYAATLIGTLQASYTDFSYLRPIWQKQTEEEALLGVSFTGIADSTNTINSDLLHKGASLVLDVNEKYAKKLGINQAQRTTAIKPEGSSSCVFGSSSGIHARHSQYYIRRIRMNKDDALAVYLSSVIPELVEPDMFSSTGVVVSIPQESPEGALLRENETALGQLERALNYRQNWIEPGFRSGANQHNVSVTISVKETEWDQLKKEMWKSREMYSGISLLPFDGGNYQQAPFEECTKEKFQDMNKLVKEIDLKLVREDRDVTNRIDQLACSGGACEIT